MSAAQELTQAAERLEWMDKQATLGPWVADGDRVEANFWSTDEEGFADCLVTGGLAEAVDFDLIGLARELPGPLAALFRFHARVPGSITQQLLAVARAINATTKEQVR